MLLKSNQFSLAELDLIILKWSKLILISIKLLYNESYKLYCVSYKTQQAWKDGLDREQQKQTLVVSWYALSSFWLNMWSLIWTCGMGDNKQGRSQRGGTLLPRTDKIGKKIGENPKKTGEIRKKWVENQEKMWWKSGKLGITGRVTLGSLPLRTGRLATPLITNINAKCRKLTNLSCNCLYVLRHISEIITPN